jgi:ketosteroid isomerase-like protein
MNSRVGISKALAVVLAVVVVAAAGVVGYAAIHSLARGTSGNTGYLTVAAQDPGPIAGVEFVYVEATQIQIHNVNGSWITVLSQPTQVKLNYVLNTTAAFTTARVPAGSYDMLRIVVPSSGVKVAVNTSIQPLPGLSVNGLVNVTANVPSGAETGIKIYTSFTVQPGATYTLILHFHLVETGKGSFILTPQTNAQTQTTPNQFVAQLFSAHMKALASDNASALSQEYSAQANTTWNMDIDRTLNISETISGQNIASAWNSLFEKLNVTASNTTLNSVTVSGNTAQAEGYITLNITLQGKTHTLTLLDKATYTYNGQVWLITAEQLTQVSLS